MLLRIQSSIKSLSITISFLILATLLAIYNAPYDLWSPIRSGLRLPNFDSIVDSGALIYLNPRAHVYREAQTLELQWNVTKELDTPDGVTKPIYKINGQFPGPTIEARSGDTLRIHVLNLLPDDEEVAIHWHGLHMRDANRMDGVVGVTQEAIISRKSFLYDFQIADDQAGTFWYHSHSELQRADGLYGGLIVHQPAESPQLASLEDHDALLMIGDWYHRPAAKVQASYVSYKSWGLEPVPDSILLNGQGAFNCSSAIPSRHIKCEKRDAPIIRLREGRHRLRFINVGAMSGITIHVPSLSISPLTIDGGNPLSDQLSAQSIGILYPGERADVLAERMASSDADFLSIELDDENFVFQNQALTRNHIFPLLNPTAEKVRLLKLPDTSFFDGLEYFNVSAATGVALNTETLQAIPQQNILIYTKVEILQHFGNVPMGFINRTSWAPQSSPATALIDLERSQYDGNQLVPVINPNSSNILDSPQTDSPYWVDITINNLDEKGHPFHLHGYDFYVLQTWKSPHGGYHTYNPYDVSEDTNLPQPLGGPYNIVNPVLKDTVYVPRMGYVVLRIRADNPGIWFLHCHILWHQGTGMAMALQVGET